MKITVMNFKKALTHAGTFHADDVMSTAFLRILNPEINVERTFRVPEDTPEGTLIFDIGGGEFDHHQVNNEIRDNGIPYAAFGKLVRAFGGELGLSEESLATFQRDVVEPIDSTDNGGSPDPLSRVISAFNPTWDESADATARFWEAEAIAESLLRKEINTLKSIDSAREIVLAAAEKMEDGVVVLEQYAPQDALQEVPEAQFVVYPSARGGWNIQTVPSDENPMVGRTPFPDEWLGHPDASLGMTFCHPGNFLASAETREQAINIAHLAVKRGGK